MLDAFRKKKRQGNVRRNLQKYSQKLLTVAEKSVFSLQSVGYSPEINKVETNQKLSSSSQVNISEILPEMSNKFEGYLTHNWIDEPTTYQTDVEIFENGENDSLDWSTIGPRFREKLSEWAINYRPTHNQLRHLLSICNETLPIELPVDPRTIFGTARTIQTTTFPDGSQYWHNSLISSLQTILHSIPCLPRQLSLNINIDGLPLYESSREQFWPILCNIHQLHKIEPIVVGIYCGKRKYQRLLCFIGRFCPKKELIF